MKPREFWAEEDYRHGYEALQEENTKLAEQVTVLNRQDHSAWRALGYGIVIGIVCMGLLNFIRTDLYTIPVDWIDDDNNRILFQCEDRTTEWIPMPTCKKAPNNGKGAEEE
jgi:hypothetical protein